MNATKRTVVFGFLSAALLLNLASLSNAKGQGKYSSGHRDDPSAAQTSGKGSTKPNAQWSADPEHGWVRADERQELKNRTKRSKGNVENKKKTVGNANGKKL